MTKVPRDIETMFRKELGDVTPYMSIIDLASKELINNYQISEIQQLAKKHGHSRLAVGHLDLKRVIVFVHVSQMAFVNSRADGFCDEVREFQKALTNDKSSPNLDGLDKLRKTIYMMVASKAGSDKPPDKTNEEMYKKYAGSIELAIADYYRRIRNIEFHGGNGGCDSHPKLSKEELHEIKKLYKHKPNTFNNLTSRDVILYSQAWQKIAVNLCQKLVNLDEVVNELCAKYLAHTPKRRDNAITNKLRQDYLQSDEFIDRLRTTTNGWVA